MSFPELLTDGGNYAIIYTINKNGQQPIHGAYWTKEEWIVCQWDSEGYRISRACPSDLDITKEIKGLSGLFQTQKEGEETSGTV